MADNKVNSGLLEFSEDQKVFVALDAETSEVKKAVTIDGDGVETDITGEDVTVEALSITENGTYSETGKAYSPVTVNVAGAASDYSTAVVTVVNNSDNPVGVSGAFINEEEQTTQGSYPADPQETITITTVLYKGLSFVSNMGITPFEVTGSAEKEGATAVVTGNCTITFINGED